MATMLEIYEVTSAECNEGAINGKVADALTSATVRNDGQTRCDKTKSKQTVSEKFECYFLDRLPRELRDNIYEHLLVVPGSVMVPRHEANEASFLALSLIAATCTQVHDEAKEIFYGRNSFYVDASPDDHFKLASRALSRWLAHLSNSEKRCVKRVHIRLRPSSRLMGDVIHDILLLAGLHWPDEDDMRVELEDNRIFEEVARLIDGAVVSGWLSCLRDFDNFDLRKITVMPERDGSYFDMLSEAWAQDFQECVAAVLNGREPELKWVRHKQKAKIGEETVIT